MPTTSTLSSGTCGFLLAISTPAHSTKFAIQHQGLRPTTKHRRTDKQVAQPPNIALALPRRKKHPLVRELRTHGVLKRLLPIHALHLRRSHGDGGRARTSMPHSGTRSRLLNTTMRSQTGPKVEEGSGADAAAAALISALPLPRSLRHFCSAPGGKDDECLNKLIGPQKIGRCANSVKWAVGYSGSALHNGEPKEGITSTI